MIRKLVVYTAIVVCLLCPQVKANQHSVSTVKESIVKQSLELGIDPALALSIAKSESGFRHEARSAHGAVGVFQLMPSTAKRLGVNPYYLSGNIKGGLMYYKKMYSIFGSTELALAAYNAGPKIVKQYNKVPPFRETKKFVSQIMNEYHHQKANPDPSIAKMKNGSTKGVSKTNNIVKVSNVPPRPVVAEKLETKIAEAKPNVIEKQEHKIVELKTTLKPAVAEKAVPKVAEHKAPLKPVVAQKVEVKVVKAAPKSVVAQKVETKVVKAATKPVVAQKTEVKVTKVAPKPVVAVRPEHKAMEHKVVSRKIITEKTGPKSPVRSIIPAQGVV